MYANGKDIFSWIAKLRGIFTQFKAANSEVPDLEKKHRAMGLLVVWSAYVGVDGTIIGDWRPSVLL